MIICKIVYPIIIDAREQRLELNTQGDMNDVLTKQGSHLEFSVPPSYIQP